MANQNIPGRNLPNIASSAYRPISYSQMIQMKRRSAICCGAAASDPVKHPLIGANQSRLHTSFGRVTAPPPVILEYDVNEDTPVCEPVPWDPPVEGNGCWCYYRKTFTVDNSYFRIQFRNVPELLEGQDGWRIRFYSNDADLGDPVLTIGNDPQDKADPLPEDPNSAWTSNVAFTVPPSGVDAFLTTQAPLTGELVIDLYYTQPCPPNGQLNYAVYNSDRTTPIPANPTSWGTLDTSGKINVILSATDTFGNTSLYGSSIFPFDGGSTGYDNIVMVATGFFIPPSTGYYKFKYGSDDGFIMSINGTTINNDTSFTTCQCSGNILTNATGLLVQNTKYPLIMLVPEGSGGLGLYIQEVQYSVNNTTFSVLANTFLSRCSNI